MEIEFGSRRLAALCNSQSAMRSRLGPQCARALMRRLSQLHAAPNLEALHPRHMPIGRCHELTGDLRGTLSMDLKHPQRLVFRPKPPAPHRADGSLDWSAVTAIVIEGIDDTH